jgi:hypothetical protein
VNIREPMPSWTCSQTDQSWRAGGGSAVGPVQLVGQRAPITPALVEPGEDESAPGGDGDRVQRQPVPVSPQVRQERRGAQHPVQAAGPAVVRAADRADRAATALRVRRRLGSGHRDRPATAVPAKVVKAGQGAAGAILKPMPEKPVRAVVPGTDNNVPPGGLRRRRHF